MLEAVRKPQSRRRTILSLAGAAAALLALGPVLACRAPSAPPGPASGERPAIDLDRFRLVDLTHAYGEETLYWPTATERFELERRSFGETEAGYFYADNAFSTPEHGGTHLDAPIHFAADRTTLDEVPLERLVAPVVVIDVSDRAAADPDYRLTRQDVIDWESAHGRVRGGTAVLLRTGWDARWPDALAYLGDDTPGDAAGLHFPAYGADSARLLVEERRVALLGVDTASLDHGPSRDFRVHRIANEADVPGLENLKGLGTLPETGAWLIALPIKIRGGSGGPTRVVALVPRAFDATTAGD